MKFGQNMDVDESNLDLECPGYWSKVKVKGQGHQVKNVILDLI